MLSWLLNRHLHRLLLSGGGRRARGAAHMLIWSLSGVSIGIASLYAHHYCCMCIPLWSTYWLAALAVSWLKCELGLRKT